MAKHFYNEPEALVLDALLSVATLGPDLTLDRQTKTIWRAGHDRKTVALLSGGGAGHEPAHAGYVGQGMLAAAVSGSIFASPSVAQILSGIGRVAGPAGVLLIIKNYTGDMFHFHLAAEKAEASLGIPVKVLVVGDDVAVGRRQSGKVGRRGLAGTVLVHKILGAYTKEPHVSLDDAWALGQQVVENLVTVGASLEHVHVPGRATAIAAAEDQVELGMGIHNEPGCRVLRPRPDLSSLIDTMLDQLLLMDDPDRAYVDFSNWDTVVVVVNNLGGVSPLEFGGITTKVITGLATRGLGIARIVSGTLMTSLNCQGFSITLLKATSEMLRHIDAPTDALGWTGCRHIHRESRESDTATTGFRYNRIDASQNQMSSGTRLDASSFRIAVSEACRRLIAAEPRITDHDMLVGDGDCGITLARGARALLERLESEPVGEDAVAAVMSLTDTIENHMDGTSGAIYGIFFAALAAQLRTVESGPLTLAKWARIAAGALEKLQKATPARQGDRTLMDALEPFVNTLSRGGTISAAVSAARVGVDATRGMAPSLGRAVYVEASMWQQVPDPGAEGVLCILEGLEAYAQERNIV